MKASYQEGVVGLLMLYALAYFLFQQSAVACLPTRQCNAANAMLQRCQPSLCNMHYWPQRLPVASQL